MIQSLKSLNRYILALLYVVLEFELAEPLLDISSLPGWPVMN